MNEEARIFSQRMICPDRSGPGEIVVRDGMIVSVEDRERPSPDALDWGRDDLVPGLVDIHTDNLEKHFMPRPGAAWDAFGAALAHDVQCAGAGITTVFDSLSLAGGKDDLDRRATLCAMIEGVDAAVAAHALRIEHLLHLRCQSATPDLLNLLTPHLDHPRLKLLSTMDRRRDLESLERRLSRDRALGRDLSEYEQKRERLTRGQDWSRAPANRAAVADIAHRLALPLAAHDDTTIEDVELGVSEGCTIAEFPMAMAAAERSRAHGMTIVMGAPNFVRGCSHAGNLSARDAAAARLLDALCSDYVPMSMLRAAYLLMEPPFAWEPHAAIATVTRAPALSVRLADRGALEPGLRADVVRVARAANGWPVARETWLQGRRVA